MENSPPSTNQQNTWSASLCKLVLQQWLPLQAWLLHGLSVEALSTLATQEDLRLPGPWMAARSLHTPCGFLEAAAFPTSPAVPLSTPRTRARGSGAGGPAVDVRSTVLTALGQRCELASCPHVRLHFMPQGACCPFLAPRPARHSVAGGHGKSAPGVIHLQPLT